MVGSGASALRRFRSLQLGGMSLPDYGFYVLCATAGVLLAAQAVLHPTQFGPICIFGLPQGSVHAPVALGYTVGHRVLHLVNFPHGGGVTVGGYVCATNCGFL